MFKLKEEGKEAALKEALERVQTLKEIPGLQRFEVVTNSKEAPESNYEISLIFDFNSIEDLITKANDLVKFPGYSERACNVWKRDKYKKEFAESKGYKVITIWEDELQLVKNEIINFLKNETSKN